MALTDKQKVILAQLVAQEVEVQKQQGNQFFLADLVVMPVDQRRALVEGWLTLTKSRLLGTRSRLDTLKVEQEQRIDAEIAAVDDLLAAPAAETR